MRLLLPLALFALAPAASAQEEPSRLPAAEATAVVVDVVVRDGTGRPVTDLGRGDFELLEDGVLQAIESFARPRGLSENGAADPSRAIGTVEGTSAEGEPWAPRGSTLAFVLDRLSTEGRVATERALGDYLEQRRAEDVAGLFSIEGSLVILQDFTADAALLQAAVDAVPSRAAHAGPTQLDAARARAGRRLAANAARAVWLQTAQPKNAAQGMARAQAQIAATQASMAQAAAEAFDRLERDQHGYVTANALTAIVDALRAVPGRKAVVLFSEGLFRSEANEQRFLAAVHAANRANVSVYTIEAAGLQVTSYESLAREELVSAGNMTLARQVAGDEGGGSWLRSLESVEDTVRFHPRASLEWIAERTGGTFQRDTNDLATALREIGDDLRSYYLLGYTPSNTAFDGRFRKIEVRVRQRGLAVRARSGYFAVRSSGAVLSHVAPALALLEAGKRPDDLPVYATALAFPDGNDPARVPLSLAVPAAAVARLAPANGPRPQTRDLTLLARVCDADGRPVEAMSRRIVFQPQAAPQDAELRLLRDAWLAPGRYRLEAVAYEATSGRAGVTSVEFEVGRGRSALERAQLMIVRSVRPAAESELETGHPFRFGDVELEPLAGQVVVHDRRRPLVFQLAMFAAGADPSPATVAVWRGERRVGQGSIQLGAPEPGGIRRYVGEAPTGALRPGRHELRVTLSASAGERVLRVPFTVSE